jgi:hypothetical protein
MGTLDTVVSKEVMLSNRLGNVKIWRSTMKSILMKEDLWDLVADPPIQSASSSSGKDKLDRAEQILPLIESERDKLRKRRLRAKSIIELSVDIDLRVHIEEEDDPRIAWKNLLALFQTNTIADTMLVLNRWEQLRMEEHMDVATFFTKVYEIKRELQLARHAQTTGVLVHRALSRLPGRFHHLVQQIRSERIMPTLEELHARLQMEENFQVGERKQDRHDPEEALVMRIRNVVRRRYSQAPHSFGNYSHARPQGYGNNHFGRPSGFVNQELVCHRCHKPGHTARNCLAPAPLHQTPIGYGQSSALSRGTSSSNHAGQGAPNPNSFGVNILHDNSSEIHLPELPSEELLEAAYRQGRIG